MRARDKNSIFSTGGNFALNMGFYWSCTLVACSYVLLSIGIAEEHRKMGKTWAYSLHDWTQGGRSGGKV